MASRSTRLLLLAIVIELFAFVFSDSFFKFLPYVGGLAGVVIGVIGLVVAIVGVSARE